jgi:hypothetical protein
MLEEHGCGERIDVPLAPAGRPIERPNRAERGGGRIPLIDVVDRKAAATGKHIADLTDLRRPSGFISVAIKGKPHDDRDRFQALGLTEKLRDRRALARAAQDRSGGRRDSAHWVGDGKTDPPLAVIDRDPSSERPSAYHGQIVTPGCSAAAPTTVTGGKDAAPTVPISYP